MRITFILPGFVSIPMGGVKVVHEYASRLAERGHDITIIYPDTTKTGALWEQSIQFLRNIHFKINKNRSTLYYTPPKNVNVLVIRKINTKYIPAGDAVIACGWQTAQDVYRLPEIHGKKFYFLQHYETFFRSKRHVLTTFQLPLKKIAIAQWIIDELRKIGQDAAGPIANAIDHNEFFIESDSKERPIDIIAVYHHKKVKGPKDLINTLKILKKQQNITATIIAARKPIHRIPAWVNVEIRPSIEKLRHLYNSSKIFLHTSHTEGWGLPVMEAMACGCAIVAANNLGVKKYLTHEDNALLASPGDCIKLSKHIITLFKNDNSRTNLSENGLKTVARYSWNNSCINFESILKINSI